MEDTNKYAVKLLYVDQYMFSDHVLLTVHLQKLGYSAYEAAVITDVVTSPNSDNVIEEFSNIGEAYDFWSKLPENIYAEIIELK